LKTTPKISVIIPFFNAEMFLERAINSVLNQSFKNFEVLLINDGSTDNSAIIAKQFIKNSTQIKYLKTENKGPGIARNTGIKHTKGKYLVFLDADDILDKNALKNLHTCITSTKSDLGIARHKMLTSNGDEIKTANLFNDTILTKFETVKAFLKNEIIPTSWAKIYKTEIAKKTFFPDLFWKEDDVFILNYLQKAKKIALTNKVVLFNHCYSNSLTRQLISTEMVKDIFTSYSLQDKYIPHALKSLFLKQQIQTLLDLFLIFKIDSKKMEKDKKEIASLLKKRASDLAHLSTKINLKKRILLFLLNLSNQIGISFVLLLLSFLKNNQIKKLKEIKN